MTLSKSICLLCILSTSSFAPGASADITGTWNLQGVLRIDSSVKGKTITVKNAFPAVASFDTVDSLRQFNLKNKSFELPGQWSARQNKFTGAPDAAAVRALMNVIKKDLSARSNLALSLEAGKWTLTGKETKSGKSTKLSGTLTIKAKTFFQGYTTKKGEPYSGSLNITYVFTGIRA
ncbi:MAG: hypothetical protein ABL925_03035 [Methylococcales bacterium]